MDWFLKKRKLLDKRGSREAHSRWKKHGQEGGNHGIHSLANGITEG